MRARVCQRGVGNRNRIQAIEKGGSDLPSASSIHSSTQSPSRGSSPFCAIAYVKKVEAGGELTNLQRQSELPPTNLCPDRLRSHPGLQRNCKAVDRYQRLVKLYRFPNVI